MSILREQLVTGLKCKRSGPVSVWKTVNRGGKRKIETRLLTTVLYQPVHRDQCDENSYSLSSVQ